MLNAHKSGLLVRWLRIHEAEEEASSLDSFIQSGNIADDLAEICSILGMDIDIEDIESCLTQGDVPRGVDKEKLIHDIHDKMRGLSLKIEDICENAEGGYVVSQNVTYNEESENDTVFLLKNYKSIKDVVQRWSPPFGQVRGVL